MNMEHIPRLLRHPELGLMLEFQVGRKWSHVVARDAREVFVKRVPNTVIEQDSIVVDYPKGLVEAAERFIHPCMGIAQVTPEAHNILEEIMKTYSTKAAAKKGLIRMGGDAGQFDALAQQVGDKWHLDDSKVAAPVRADARSKTPSKKQAEAVTKHFDKRPKVKVEKTLAEERTINMKKGGKPKATASAPKVKRPIVIKDTGEKAPSRKSQARALYAAIGAANRIGYLDQVEAMGVKRSTAASWSSEFRRG